MRLLIALLVFVLLALHYRLWVGEGSQAELAALRQEIAAQRGELERLGARNAKLRAEVVDLGSGLEALEERARAELGMIRPGETFLQVIEPRRSEEPPH
ncbi:MULTISPECIES: cell division protein FtsB [Marichromatium]|uniref:Cell division protein FtsB n=1 Tax=Marichromatium gracile TaxID=1048 RepID=A0A4R4ADH7_MARGR|nr:MULTISPECIES: cell division protein FtsB [Marichromatium]MBO8086644.1 cell division protein FtsB [Marichromatium sp.]MBK1709247.1 cell division protein FtsB [Marichromatium gracile]RNE90566.1 cell division protein FtsB [Marichromatium sp. AB31]RNE94030.1 cell division protein FtsB [Marichromatium sp. AB32]TCW37143.1 cell division protein FtsB [Marichromatium gracile]